MTLFDDYLLLTLAVVMALGAGTRCCLCSRPLEWSAYLGCLQFFPGASLGWSRCC